MHLFLGSQNGHRATPPTYGSMTVRTTKCNAIGYDETAVSFLISYFTIYLGHKPPPSCGENPLCAWQGSRLYHSTEPLAQGLLCNMPTHCQSSEVSSRLLMGSTGGTGLSRMPVEIHSMLTKMHACEKEMDRVVLFCKFPSIFLGEGLNMAFL